MSRGKKDREEITNTEEVKETEVSDEMEKAEDDKKPEETKETDDKHVSLYVQEPFIDPSVYRQRRKKRIIRTVTIAVVATLLAVYIGGVLFHMHRFGANTTINGRNVVGKSVQSVEDMLLSDARKYTLDIKFKDSDFTFVLGDADSDVALTDSVDTLLKKHSPFLWFVNSFHSYDYKIDYTVNCDREKLEACLQASPALDRASMTESKDAKVVLEDGEAKVIPEETGTKLDTAKLYD